MNIQNIKVMISGNIMIKEETKQYIRNQINSSLKRQTKYNKDAHYLYYNKSYLRALKLSKIIGKPVNKNDFNIGESTFWFNTKTKKFNYYTKIRKHLRENYSEDYYILAELIEEVLNEYEEYKGYDIW